MSSEIVSAESAPMMISEWNEVMTQPSSACAVGIHRPIAHIAASKAMPRRAARILISVGYFACLTNSTPKNPHHFYGFYYGLARTVWRGTFACLLLSGRQPVQ